MGFVFESLKSDHYFGLAMFKEHSVDLSVKGLFRRNFIVKLD